MTPPEPLSPQEIDALLTAVHSGTVAVSPGGDAGPDEAVRYDFRRPSRVSKEQIRALGAIHDEFARLASASLSGLLRALVDLEVEAVEQTACREHLAAIATPACVFLFTMAPLAGSAVLEVAPPIAFVMIDRLLGGSGQAPAAARELTEIERAVVEQAAHRCLVDLGQAWREAGTFALRLHGFETSPPAIQITAPNEVILVAALRVKIGEVAGSLTIGYPYPLLEPVIARLGAQRWAPVSGGGPETRAQLLDSLARSTLTVRAFLGQARLTVRDLLDLAPGQLVRLETVAQGPVRVHLNDAPRFLARPGTHRARLAVEILAAVDPGKE